MPHLRPLRYSRGLTILEVAQRSGLTARVIAELEYGLRPLDTAARLSLARSYDLAPEDLKPSQPVLASLSWEYLANILSQQLILATLISTLVAILLFGGAIYAAESHAPISSERPLAQADVLRPRPRGRYLLTPTSDARGRANTTLLHHIMERAILAVSPTMTLSVTPEPRPSATPRPAPTATPLPAPTGVSSPIPTDEPSPVPTAMLQLAPAEMPSPVPAEMPSLVLTETPNPMWMDVASPAPTEVPSPAPTDAPSPAPTEMPPAPTEAPSYTLTVPGANAQGSDVAAFAMQFVGVPYVWSGADLNGFDCSGFTQYVYRQFGVDLPRVAADQYSDQYGTIVTDPNGLKPGDLIFFANTYEPGITHVGIYIGNGDVVQAMGPGIGVAVGNLREDYWAQHYYGALRPSR